MEKVTKVSQIITLIVAFLPLRIANVRYVRRNSRIGPIILAANHVSMIDFAILSSVSKLRVHLISKPFMVMTANKYLRWPIVGTWLRLNGGFPARSEGGANHGIGRALHGLKNGWSLAIFPEGGLPVEGKKRPPKSGAIVIAKESQTDIVPVYIHRKRTKIWPCYTVVSGNSIGYSELSEPAKLMKDIESLIEFVPERRR